jgi:SAM-dependent methyltransferase
MPSNTKDDKKLDNEFYKKTLRPDRQRSYKLLAKFIVKKAWPEVKSIVDYGCGAGWLLYYLKEYGPADVAGIEPNKAALSVMDKGIKPLVKFRTLKGYINLNRKYDMAICLEVAEHLDERYADRLVDNLTKNTDLVVFSAAPPGQGGWGHINEQPPEYWEEKFIIAGFKCNHLRTQQFRIYLSYKGAKKWYCKNITVFEREQ